MLAFLERVRQEVVDELVEQFDRCLADTYSRAGRYLKELKLAAFRATNDKMRLLQELGRIVLDPTITDSEVRAFIYRRVSADELRAVLEECERLVRPADDSYFDLLAQSYGYLRQFTPAVLEALDFRSHQVDDPLLAAVETLRCINRDHLRKLPVDAPLDFVPDNWRPYVVAKDGQPDRHYYELCALWELRLSLRAGDVWLHQSRRYADPASYLIPADRWTDLRPEVCQLVKTPADGNVRLTERRRELEELLERFDELIAEHHRHAKAMESLGERLKPIANAEHEHLALDAVDPDYVRRTIFTPPEDRPGRVDGQIPTESDGR